MPPENTGTPAPGSPAHDAAMIEKANASGVQIPEGGGSGPAKPEGDPPKKFAGKYDSVEALEQAYAELSKKLGAPKDGEGDKAKPAEGGQPTDIAQAMEAASAEIARDGDLSEGSRATLKKLGVPDSLIERVTAAAKAEVAEITNAMHEASGGPEAFETLRSWAAENLDPATKQAFAAMVEAGPKSAAEAFRDLRARYERVMGRDGSLLGGSKPNTGTGAAAPFGSRAEITAAMKDARYAKDAAYRAQVQARLGATEFGNLSAS